MTKFNSENEKINSEKKLVSPEINVPMWLYLSSINPKAMKYHQSNVQSTNKYMLF